MSAYSKINLGTGTGEEYKMPQVQLDFKTDSDVAQNIGHAKLAKKRYSPFEELVAPNADMGIVQDMLKQQRQKREIEDALNGASAPVPVGVDAFK